MNSAREERCFNLFKNYDLRFEEEGYKDFSLERSDARIEHLDNKKV